LLPVKPYARMPIIRQPKERPPAMPAIWPYPKPEYLPVCEDPPVVVDEDELDVAVTDAKSLLPVATSALVIAAVSAKFDEIAEAMEESVTDIW